MPKVAVARIQPQQNRIRTRFDDLEFGSEYVAEEDRAGRKSLYGSTGRAKIGISVAVVR